MADIVFEDSAVNVDSVPFHSDPDEQTSAVHALRLTGGLSLQNLSIRGLYCNPPDLSRSDQNWSDLIRSDQNFQIKFTSHCQLNSSELF